MDGPAPAAAALDWEESAGVSAPLYDIVDVVFELGSRGFFRRQVRAAAELFRGAALYPAVKKRSRSNFAQISYSIFI